MLSDRKWSKDGVGYVVKDVKGTCLLPDSMEEPQELEQQHSKTFLFCFVGTVKLRPVKIDVF